MNADVRCNKIQGRSNSYDLPSKRKVYILSDQRFDDNILSAKFSRGGEFMIMVLQQNLGINVMHSIGTTMEY